MTPIQKIFKKNRGLSERIAKFNKETDKKITSLTANTIRKAISGGKVNFDSKFEIRAILIDLEVIKEGEYTTTSLFGE